MLSTVIFKENGTKQVLKNVIKVFLNDNCVEAIKLPQLTEEEIATKIAAIRPLILSGNTERNRVLAWLENPNYGEISEGEINLLASEFMNTFIAQKTIEVKIAGEWYFLKTYKSFSRRFDNGDFEYISLFRNSDTYKMSSNEENKYIYLTKRDFDYQAYYSLVDLDFWTVLEATEEEFEIQKQEILAHRFDNMDFERALRNHAPIEIMISKNPDENSCQLLMQGYINSYDSDEKKTLVNHLLNSYSQQQLTRVPLNLQDVLRVLEDDKEFSLNIRGTVVNYVYNYRNCCLTANKHICERCGNIVNEENVLIDGDGTPICRGCAISGTFARVKEYHCTREFFHPMERGTGKASDRSLFGCEIEMIKKRNHSEERLFNSEIANFCYGGGNRAKFEHDGSLGNRGEEMITQPLSKSWILENMTDWLNALGQIYQVNNDCGLHVHVDKNALTMEQWDSIYRFLAANHTSLSNVGAIRPSKYYCNYNKIDEAVECNPNSPHSYQTSNDHGNPINFLGNHGSANGRTVEFRFFDGTLDPEKWMKNIKFVFTLLDLAEEGKLPTTRIKII